MIKNRFLLALALLIFTLGSISLMQAQPNPDGQYDPKAGGEPKGKLADAINNSGDTGTRSFLPSAP